MSGSILIMGIGNTLLSDDGIGPYICKLLQNKNLPKNVSVVDGGTQGLNLMPFFEGIERVILIDAIEAKGAKAGDLVVIEQEDIIKTLNQKMSVHEIGIVDLLLSLDLVGNEPKELKLMGLVPKSLEFAYGLSDEIEKQIPTLLDAIYKQIEIWNKKEALC